MGKQVLNFLTRNKMDENLALIFGQVILHKVSILIILQMTVIWPATRGYFSNSVLLSPPVSLDTLSYWDVSR